MRKTKETLVYILITIISFGSSVYLLISTDSKFLFIIPFIIYGILITLISRNKKILNYVKNDFKNLGYELISERPLKSSESKIEIKPSILTSGNQPLKAYKNKYKRIFTAKSNKGKLVELNTIVTENKDGTLKIEIKQKKKL